MASKAYGWTLTENKFLTRRDVRRILIKNYIAYYIIDDDKSCIVILRVVYGKRDQDYFMKDISS